MIKHIKHRQQRKVERRIFNSISDSEGSKTKAEEVLMRDFLRDFIKNLPIETLKKMFNIEIINPFCKDFEEKLREKMIGMSQIEREAIQEQVFQLRWQNSIEFRGEYIEEISEDEQSHPWY